MNGPNLMSEESEPQKTRKQMLMMKADTLGITYSNAISEEKLAEKIAAKLEGDEKEATEEVVPLTSSEYRQKLIDEATKLVRIRVQNLDPKKANLPGEFLTVANEYIGTIRKFVPFGEATDEGYHVPHCIYEMMRERKFVHVRMKRNPATGQEYPDPIDMREFAIEVLPQLTEVELKELAAAQLASGSIGD
jgi:hypothetical protein